MNTFIINKTIAFVPRGVVSQISKRFFYSLPDVEYKNSGLKNFLSAEALNRHLKLHQNDVERANNLVQRTPWENTSINQAISQSFNSAEDAPFFEAISSHFNHSFFWQSLTNKKNLPSIYMQKAIELDFGSINAFQKKFSQTASSLNSAGFVWLVFHDKTLRIISTFGNGSPLELQNCYPLLCLDVYEHAYMHDYGTDKNKYIANFWNKVDWEFVENKFLNSLVTDREYKAKIAKLAEDQMEAYVESHPSKYIDKDEI
ncbi:hypothetical protein DICPUDRAFT_84896 [Dictyostelium purpureum]|uniref:Superoxide dismutase n=1 Tax=Dictyostelium purpureum TaxID=5786 RepID=F1A424_DICPU|nr:uncharacterized protein DICPUDRAFT_84896 [Dictyostelium purpureum]EGC29056.1 hypothetical protein DICPUDRAFT_84896 [Dictyostelium purpureum]|eukprot:XP_003294417.1 hypothetical protein DICPUDRAFT_84896 [Dictyostelium purpureum]